MFGRLYRLRRIKDMFSESKKRELERQFNFYSVGKEYDSTSRVEFNAKMWALQDAVRIFGYQFEFKMKEGIDGVECGFYRLVKMYK